MATSVRHWRLFVDESGDFADRRMDVAVAGLLLRADGPGPAGVRRALLEAVPGIPWPLHASFLNRPVLFALSRQAAAQARSLSAPPARLLDQAVAEILEVLRRHDPDALATSLDRVGHARFPERRVLDRFSRRADAEAPDAVEVIRDQITEMWAAVGRAVRSLPLAQVPARKGTYAANQQGAALIFCTSEGQRGDAWTTGTSREADSARYLSLLEILIERVGAGLARLPGNHQLWLDVLVRDIFDRTLGRSRPLHVRDLGAIASRLQARPRSGVRIVPAGTPRFDEGVAAPHVLTDFIVNRARWMLAVRKPPLIDIEGRLRAMFAADLRSGEPPLPNLAASGDAAKYLRGEQPSLPPAHAGLRRWAYDQALEWAAATQSAPGGVT